MPRGRGWPAACKAFWKNRLAATASRSAENQKSIVAPVESPARYRYRQLPPWRMYVSSTLQEPLVGFNSRRHLLFSSGAALHPVTSKNSNVRRARPQNEGVRFASPLGSGWSAIEHH